MKSQPELSIIIVNYNVCKLLDNCLASIFETKGDLDIEIIVIDNNSGDGSIEMIRSKFPQVHLIANQNNMGFAGATNQGLKIAKGKYLFLLNPDTIVLPAALTQLTQLLNNSLKVGAVGPKLLNPDHTLQPSCRSFPNLLNTVVFSFIGYERIPKQANPSRYLFECWDHSKVLAVDYVIGAALMVKRSTLAEVGYLDEEFFFYGEEKDWCYRARKLGYKTYFCPESEIIHLGGQSSAQVSKFALTQLYQNHEKFLHKHYNASYALLLIWLLRLGLIVKAVAFNLAGLTRSNKHNVLRQKAIHHINVLQILLANSSGSK